MDMTPSDFEKVSDPNALGMCRITINIETMQNLIEFTNQRVGKMFNQQELAFLINPLLWSGLRVLLEQKLNTPEIVAPTAKQIIQIDQFKDKNIQ